MADSRTGEGNIQDEPIVPENKKIVGKKKPYMDGGTSKGHKNNKIYGILHRKLYSISYNKL